MAGSGRKVFTAGDVLTASDVQNYLQDQTVMVFGGTAARSAAIATPTEGMLAVTTDTDEIDYYNGSEWVSALPVGAWTSYTPTFTNFTLGNGTIGFAYAQIGKTVHVRGGMTLGTTSSFSGTISISLPVNSLATSGNPLVGSVRLTDLATQNYYGFVQIATASTIQLIALNASTTWLTGSTVNTTTPFTWGTGDDIRFFLTYQSV